AGDQLVKRERLTVEIDLTRRDPLEHDCQRLVEHLASFVRVAVDKLAERAAAQAKVDSAAAKLVQHADFFEQPDWAVERQDVAQWPESQPTRALGNGGQKQVRRRHRGQLGRMVLSQVVAVQTRSIGQLEHTQALLIRLGLAPARFVEPVEESKLYRHTAAR